MEDKTKPCQSHNAAQKSAVCACLPRIYIWNNEPEHMQKTQCDCEWLFLCVGLCFYDDKSGKVEKALQVYLEMYQVYFISI